MSDKIVNDDDLPIHWIKEQSTSRPNQSYYFNTRTGQSQWTLPVSPGDEQRNPLTKKEPVQSTPKENGRTSEKPIKISDHSKQIKKRQSKTPAQDRLQNLAEQIKAEPSAKERSRYVNDLVKNATPAQKITRKVVSPSKNIQRLGKTTDKISLERAKSDSSKVRNIKLPSPKKSHQTPSVKTPTTLYEKEISSVLSTDEIPSLFPSRTPGQDRLNRLRHSQNPTTDNKPDESAQQTLYVIQSEFGLLENKSTDTNKECTVTYEDEPMDWEPCDIFDQIENVVCNEFSRPYIIPDTNIFLAELSCIRHAIGKDGKYNVLVPFAVLQELDRLKSRHSDSKISRLASCAIRFIYDELKSKTPRLQGQKATEDCSHLIDVANADDKILNCCLQILRQSPDTTLITNDMNLCNKAIASGITTMTSKEYKAKYYSK